MGEVFDQVREAVAAVLVSRTEFPFVSRLAPVSVEGLVSGVLISPTELITAAHVVQAADAVTALFPDGERMEARVASSRPAYDIALLELARPAAAKPTPLEDSNEVRTGDQMLVVGAPLGQAHTRPWGT